MLRIWMVAEAERMCCALVLAAGLTAFGQTNTPPACADWVVRSWQTKDGLPQNTVYAMLQTRDGFLWIGTGGGLARFDGARFRTYGLEDGLGSVDISTLVEDRDGVLWVGTHGGGLSRWDNGRFITYNRSNGLPATTVEALAADRNGSLWIGTAQGLVNFTNGVFRMTGPADGLPQRQIRALMQDSKGVLWVSVLLENLFRRIDGRFVPLQGPDPHPQGAYGLFEDSEGNIWAGGEGAVWRLRHGTWTSYTATNGVPARSIESFAQLKGGGIWAGARHVGLLSFSGDGFENQSLQFIKPNEDIRTLMTARDGSVWAGTETSGLDRILPRRVRAWGEAEGLNHLVVSVAEDKSGSLWVTTQVGGISRLLNGRFKKVEDTVMGSRRVCYTSLATADGSVWVAGEQFLCRFHEGQPTKAYAEQPVKGETIRAMCEDGDSIWLGTYSSTLLKVVAGKIETAATNGTFGAGITSLTREAPDTLWIGTISGLYRWEQGRIREWSTADGLLSANVRSLFREADGTLWIGTLGGGLARLKDGRIVNITTRDGLADDVISQIVSDDYGHLWVGCNHGIMRLDRSELDELAEGKVSSMHAVLLGQDEGMISEQCTGGHSPTAVKTRSGRLLFPTAGGLVEIDPLKWQDPPAIALPATIDEVKVDGQPRSPFAKLTMPPDSRRLEIGFAAPDLRGNGTTRFRFRLDPLDKSWVNSGSRRTAFYPAIPPGEYTFKVGANDYRGHWSQNAATLAISVQPYLWQTLWFRIAAGIAVAGAGCMWFLQRTTQLKARNTAQEEFTRQLMQSQENERKRVAFELHDGLGQDLLLIKNRVKLLASDPRHPPAVAHQLLEISTHARQAIADVRAISHALRPSALEQVGFTKAVEWMIEQIAETTTAKFSTELENVDGLLPREMEINLYRVVQEGLNNVLKHAAASEVIVEIKRHWPGILISILDNGKGFDVETVERGGLRQSFGLAAMRERAKVLGGTIDLQSTPCKGTRLTLHVPLVGNGHEFYGSKDQGLSRR